MQERGGEKHARERDSRESRDREEAAEENIFLHRAHERGNWERSERRREDLSSLSHDKTDVREREMRESQLVREEERKM